MFNNISFAVCRDVPDYRDRKCLFIYQKHSSTVSTSAQSVPSGGGILAAVTSGGQAGPNI